MKKLLLLLCLVLTVGCIQDQQVVEINTRIDNLYARLDAVEARLRRLERGMGRTGTKEAGALYSYIKNLEGEIYNLRGDMDTSNQNIVELQKRVEDLEYEVSQIKEELSKLKSATGATEEQQTVAPPSLPIVTPEGLYNAALSDVKKGSFKSAVEKFQKFLKKYPDHRLASNAFYWIGEAYYGMKRYRDAILQFEDLRRRYPNSPKIPASMLKEAKAFLELKDKNSARIILEQLIRFYPRSKEAAAARRMLKSLRR